jgi:hypothetical protein
MHKALLRWHLGSVPPVSTAHAGGERRGLPPRRGGVSELYDWEGYTASVSMGQGQLPFVSQSVQYWGPWLRR